MVPFGLMNAPSVFMCLINGVFHSYLDRFLLVLRDDIMIYSRSQKDHEEHLHLVLQCLRDNQIYANLVKCNFFQLEIQYLGHIILGDGIFVDPMKI